MCCIIVLCACNQSSRSATEQASEAVIPKCFGGARTLLQKEYDREQSDMWCCTKIRLGESTGPIFEDMSVPYSVNGFQGIDSNVRFDRRFEGGRLNSC